VPTWNKYPIANTAKTAKVNPKINIRDLIVAGQRSHFLINKIKKLN
jgi:hypothetical protein